MYSRRGFIKSAFAAGALVTTGYMAFLKYFKEPPTPDPVPTSTPTPTPTETLESKIHRNLLSYVPDIKNLDARVINAAVVQIRDDIYNNNLDRVEVKIGDITYNAWDYIKGAIDFVLPGLEKVDLNNYSDMDLRQILLPTTLRTIDIKSILDGNREIKYNLVGLGYGLKNVTPESLGGKSPQELLGERVRDFYSDKNSKDYEEAKYFSKGAAIDNWPNSTAAFLEVRDSMFDNGEDAPLFVIGWSRYIVGEQQSPDFASLVSRSMEEPLAAYFGRANYPGKSPDGKVYVHTEPWVSYNGKLIGAWMFKEEFLKDYQRSTWPDFKGELNEPYIVLMGPDSRFYNPYTLKPIPK